MRNRSTDKAALNHIQLNVLMNYTVSLAKWLLELF